MTGLYLLRLGVYFLVILLPLFHPALILYLDTAGVWFFLVLLPGECLAARIPSLKKALGVGLLLLFVPFLAEGGTGQAFGRAGLGLLFWLSTRLIFFRGVTKLLYPEPFLMGLFFFRILRLSRSSGEISQMSRIFDPVSVGILTLLFLLYTFAIYRAEYRLPESRSRPKSLLYLLVFTLLLILPAAFFPRSYGKFIRILGTSNSVFQGRYRPVDSRGDPSEGRGNLRDDKGGSPNLREGSSEEGMAPDLLMASGDWNPTDKPAGRQDVQHLVMILRSAVEPVYLADQYFSVLDPVEGLQADPVFPLNSLMDHQLLETWINPDLESGAYRIPVWIDVFSTISDRVSSYAPVKMEPTVQDRNYSPLSYSYRALSMISRISLGESPSVSGDMEEELPELAPFLEVNLEEKDRRAYEQLLSGILSPRDGYGDRIRKILIFYRKYQYNVGFTEDVSIRAISRFLFETRSGDCTEFSNSAAILGRLAGIPSRVVTGYLMAGSLQTPAHKDGLEEIRRNYPPLEELPSEELYMVTTSHRHSWVQFYFPPYGWVDYEATSYGIPPLFQGNPNNYDVVIPDISAWNRPEPAVPIPWLLLFRFFLTGGTVLLLFLYVRRWSRLLSLVILSQRKEEQGLKSLYALLLIRLRARGYALKSPDGTPEEYAALHPEFQEFARVYTQSLYAREEGESRRISHRTLRKEYRKLLRQKRGPFVLLREVFTLKDYPFL